MMERTIPESQSLDVALTERTASKTQTVAITGSTGLVGTALVQATESRGDRVVKLVRGEPTSRSETRWSPQHGLIEPSRLEEVEVLVHLAGENIADRRWDREKKKRIRDSRVAGTRTLCEALAKLKHPPKVLVAASAIGFFGDRGDVELDESAGPGSGFLADVCREWESATVPAADAGIRVVNLRIGVILSRHGGALPKMLTPFKMGAGGIVGSGKQFWSWIALDDVVGAIRHSIDYESLEGPVNAVSPQPVTNAEFTQTLAKVLHRPALLPMPAIAARLALGEMATELLLASARVVPRRLQRTGYLFTLPTLEVALRHEID